MNKLLSILLVVFLISPIISSAESIQAMQKVYPYMSKVEVEKIMGPSDSFKFAENNGKDYVLNQWTNRLCNDWWNRTPLHGEDKCTFFIVYENGRVVEKGVSNISKGENPNISFMYLFN